jgi:hypothetical protein
VGRWKSLREWWGDDDVTGTSLASTGLVIWAVVAVAAIMFVWKHPAHRIDGAVATLQLVGAFLTVPILGRKLWPSRPSLTARALAGDRIVSGGQRWMEKGGFRLAAANHLRAARRRWRILIGLGAILFAPGLALAFVTPASSARAILVVVLVAVGLVLGLFGLSAMVLPRRLHAPLPPETEILSPLQLAADERFEAMLGIAGLVFVLASIVLQFVGFYF